MRPRRRSTTGSPDPSSSLPFGAPLSWATEPFGASSGSGAACIRQRRPCREHPGGAAHAYEGTEKNRQPLVDAWCWTGFAPAWPQRRSATRSFDSSSSLSSAAPSFLGHLSLSAPAVAEEPPAPDGADPAGSTPGTRRTPARAPRRSSATPSTPGAGQAVRQRGLEDGPLREALTPQALSLAQGRSTTGSSDTSSSLSFAAPTFPGRLCSQVGRACGLQPRSCALTGMRPRSSQPGWSRPAARSRVLRAGPGIRPRFGRPGRSRRAARSRGAAR